MSEDFWQGQENSEPGLRLIRQGWKVLPTQARTAFGVGVRKYYTHSKTKSTAKAMLSVLAGAGGFEPATHGFGVALKVCEVLILLAFPPVLSLFSHKTVCRNCV